MSTGPTLQQSHFRHLATLLALEAKAEQAQLQQQIQQMTPAVAEQMGNTLIQLTIRDEVAGLGGRVLITLGKRNQQLELPWTRLRVGSPVQLSEEHVTTLYGWRGVVSQVRRESIQVALLQWPAAQSDRPTFRLDLAGDEIAHQRELAALTSAEQAKGNRLAELRAVLLGERAPRFQPAAAMPPGDNGLNLSQQQAVAHALAAEDVAIIHGPPGTGKTTAVVELIRQAVQRGEKVLACAPSNLAVDNIFERLLACPELGVGANVVRIGHPARVLPALRDQTLDLLVENHPDMKLVRKLTKEAHAFRADAAKTTRAKRELGARRDMRQEAKAMLDDAHRLEEQLVERIFSGARVICATLSGLDERLFRGRHFDLCIIDEAAQSTEPGCWIPLRYSQRLVLAGDHCQLPPTVISQEAAASGLGVSLMERLLQPATGAPTLARQLDIQYRMNEQIMAFSSQIFYAGTLQADPSVAHHRLRDLYGVHASEVTNAPVLFIDTAGADYHEAVEPDGESRFNEGEVQIVQHKIEQLCEADIQALQISVISPYAAQVRLLRDRLKPQIEQGLEIGSIDGFQGRENEVVIISLVRSNSDGMIGFLADTRRMNVALTRARRQLIVIGDSATIGVHPFYQQLLDYFDQIGAYHTVWEERW